MFLLSVRNNFYIRLSSYVEEHVKKFMSEFHVFGWFPSLQNLDVFFGKFTAEQVLKSFSGRNSSQELPVFGFSNSLSYGLQESREQ